MRRRALAGPLMVAAVLAALVAIPASAQAASWTRVPTGTASDITAVDYQPPTRIWFATSAGEIFTREANGTFQKNYAHVGQSFDSIAFQPGGNIGFAVGANGVVVRSADAGATWFAVVITGSNTGCANTTASLGTVTSVRFAGSQDVYLFSGGDQVLHARADGSHALGVAGDWTDLNHKTAGGCKADLGGSSDGYFLPTNPFEGYAMSAAGGTTYYSNDWSSQASAQQKGSGTTVGGTSYKRVAADPRQPTHQWAIDVGSDGLAPEFQRTLDGWQTPLGWTYGEQGRTRAAGWDIAFGPGATTGGTVLSVGDAGQIEASTDGINFFSIPAADAPAEGWRSVSAYDASNAAVGGLGGVLETSSDANVPPSPVTPPATGISAPAPQTVGFAAPGKSPLPRSLKAKGKGAHKTVALAVAGKLQLPSGVTAARACTGKVKIVVTSGKHQLTSRSAAVHPSCGYSATLSLPASKVKKKSVTVTLSFAANAAVGASSYTKSLKLKG